jgi:hypothetical protein
MLTEDQRRHPPKEEIALVSIAPGRKMTVKSLMITATFCHDEYTIY